MLTADVDGSEAVGSIGMEVEISAGIFRVTFEERPEPWGRISVRGNRAKLFSACVS